MISDMWCDRVFSLVTSRLILSFFVQVFGLYFMQTYIGLFYHALLHRNFTTLRQVIIQRLIVSQACCG